MATCLLVLALLGLGGLASQQAPSLQELELLALWQAEQLQQKEAEIASLQHRLASVKSGDCSAANSLAGNLTVPISPSLPEMYLVRWQRPRVFVLENFLNASQCEYIINRAEPYLETSTLVGATDGGKLRRSRSAFLSRNDDRHDPVVRDMVTRMHEIVKLPIGYGEPVQVASYGPNDHYQLHKDSDSQVGRVITFLVYLMDTEEGGETIFPGIVAKGGAPLPALNFHVKEQPAMEPYCNNGAYFKIKPKQGRALIFFNHLPDLRVDEMALHGACPVKRGRKVVAQRWIRFWDEREGNIFYEQFIKPMGL
eukprot:TRINITY_DN83463_c0_g1_i1.p1 TRINITY_DN83463_c0_g1~~TRINITY_DN83463_c0_g1_i1.p1  ORF type:complete len:310 (+),score=47.50 TRINITY_DN83463_c0_g1_i1:35-964(+)